MLRKCDAVWSALAFVFGLMAICSSAAAAEGTQYRFKVGERIIYRIVIRAHEPGLEKMLTGFLMYMPTSYDETLGQTTLRYRWGVNHGTTTKNGVTSGGAPSVPSFLAKTATEDDLIGDIVVDSRGGIVSFGDRSDRDQFEYALGPAWQIMLQPLPPEGKTTWTEEEKLSIRYFVLPRGPGGFPIDQRQTVEVVPAEVTQTYTAKPPTNGQVIIDRKYLLATPDGRISQHTTGDGDYCFDSKAGYLKTLHLKYATTHKENEISFSTSCSLDASLVTGPELAKLQTQAAVSKLADDKLKAQEEKKRAAEEAKREAEEALRADELNQIPDGMEQSDLVGAENGGMFAKLSQRHLPVIGFRIETGDWGGSKRFRAFDPVYDQKPEPIAGRTLALARDGYAVGAITVNASKESVHAICVTFMKMTDKGALDPNDKYVSPWYGRKQGDSQKVLSGNGKLIYGICGRKGLNVDAIGIVTEAAPGDDTNK